MYRRHLWLPIGRGGYTGPSPVSITFSFTFDDSVFEGSGFDLAARGIDVTTVSSGLAFGYDDSPVGNLTITDVPEPHEYAMMAGLGLLGFAAWRRSRN